MYRKIVVCLVFTTIMIVGAYFRLDFLTSVTHEMSPDAINYTKMAEQIVEKSIYGYNSEQPNAYVTPGYPLFLAIFYKLSVIIDADPWTLVRYIQVILSLLILYFIFYITYTVSNNYFTAFVATAISAVYPPFIWANGALLTEVLCSFFLMGYFALHVAYLKKGKKVFTFLAGIFLGLTVIVRPEFLPIVFVVHFVLWFYRKERRQSVFVSFISNILGITLVLLPWWIRNVITLDEFISLATQTNPFYAGTFPYNDYNDTLIRIEGKTEMEMAIERLKVGFVEHPQLFSWWYTLGKLEYTYAFMYVGGGHHPLYPVLSLDQSFHQNIIWLGVASMIISLFFLKNSSIFITSIIIVMSAIRLLFVPEYRYNFTMMPFFIMLACIVGYLLINWFFTKVQNLSKKVLPIGDNLERD